MLYSDEIYIEDFKRTYCEAYRKGFIDGFNTHNAPPVAPHEPEAGYISGVDFMKIFDNRKESK